MELPTSTAALLVALGILPGVAGEKAYRLLVGVDWREDKWQRTLRLLAFSVLGLAVYSALTSVVPLPSPTYVIPSELTAADRGQIGLFAIAYLGHVASAAIVGVSSALGSRAVARVASRTAYSSAWDHFVNACVRQHWVTIGLQTGDVYLGFIDVADISVATTERDIILREPALYDPSLGHYRVLEYQSMFLPGTLINSIGVITDMKLDKRLTTPGEVLFEQKGESNDKQR